MMMMLSTGRKYKYRNTQLKWVVRHRKLYPCIVTRQHSIVAMERYLLTVKIVGCDGV
jgi:hypothetical protein